MNKKAIRGELMLLLAAFIWGTAFVAQSVGVNYIEPFTFNAIRMMIGSLTLLPCIYLLRDKKKTKKKYQSRRDWFKSQKSLLIGGISCGIILYIAGGLQQIGLLYTSVSKAGFITALYIIIVPIIGIFLKKKPSILLWVSVLLATFGMYLLCITDGFRISLGDGLTLLCAVFFSLHILTVDHFSPFVDGVKLSCIQFFVCSILSTITMLIFETPHLTSILQAWFPLIYTGVISCGIAYTFQILGQKEVPPVIASLIMSLESVFATLAGWILLRESLSTKEFIGCVLVFLAILLAQLPVPSLIQKKQKETRDVA